MFRHAASLIVLTASCLAPRPAQACWDEIGRKYGINAHLLYAIAKTESGLNPKAVNRNNPNGSYDVGLMQINSSWFSTLKRFGIAEKDLYEPCISIEVGAWILAHNIRANGKTWAAVGAYNTPNQTRGLLYALRVYRNMPLLPQPL